MEATSHATSVDTENSLTRLCTGLRVAEGHAQMIFTFDCRGIGAMMGRNLREGFYL